VFLLFKVKGPFDVPFCRTRSGAKRVEREHKQEFWKAKAARHRSGRGCYVFAVKTARAYRAGYVGMASAKFEGEVFTDGKLQRYNSFLALYKKGKPVLFLIVAPRNKGKPSKRKIAAVEKH
jgi:hypothetical protein